MNYTAALLMLLTCEAGLADGQGGAEEACSGLSDLSAALRRAALGDDEADPLPVVGVFCGVLSACSAEFVTVGLLHGHDHD